MKVVSRAFCAAMCALVLLCAAALTSPAACAAPAYQDGDYTVAFSIDGLGRHNAAWDSATVHVKNGALYVDFTLERIDPRDHAPQYDWLKTDCGTYTPTLNDATFTCVFSGVQVPHLGTVTASAQTSAMSQPYEVDYVLHIDDSTIPTASAPVSQPQESTVQPQEGTSQPQESDQASGAPADEPAEDEIPAQDDVLTTTGVTDAAEGEDTVAVTADRAETSATPASASAPGIIAIAVGAVVILGGGVAVIFRIKKGKGDEK